MSEVLFVIVIYKKTMEQSKSCSCLRKLLSKAEWDEAVYVHDNTINNIYLAGAYNKALAIGKSKGKKWIVLLDDDTAVNEAYIANVKDIVDKGKKGVWVPSLWDKNKQLSPLRKYGCKMAFNSGMLIRIEDIEKVGGFSERYPLDYLDFWMCWQYRRNNIAICDMNVQLEHRLSVHHYEEMSEQRYLSLLNAERQFAKDTGHLFDYRLLLLMRAIKWTITQHRYWQLTWKRLKDE